MNQKINQSINPAIDRFTHFCSLTISVENHTATAKTIPRLGWLLGKSREIGLLKLTGLKGKAIEPVNQVVGDFCCLFLMQQSR
jgi:hypothetical protein